MAIQPTWPGSSPPADTARQDVDNGLRQQSDLLVGQRVDLDLDARPNATATRSNVWMLGAHAPASSGAMAGCVLPIFSASSRWLNSRSSRMCRTARRARRMHHIGLSHAHKGRRVILLVDQLDVRVVSEDGELLRHLTLDPGRDYQPQG
jgi:hypothetical protein